MIIQKLIKKNIPDKLDKSWYIDLANERMSKKFGVKTGIELW